METCVLEAALVQVAMHRGLLDMEGRFGALVRDLMKLLSEKQGRKIVICGPPGSGKMTAVEVAAEVCGMELSAVENQFAKAETFAKDLKFCCPNVLKRSGGDVWSVPAVTVITQFETVEPKERRKALEAALQLKQVTMIVPVNCIRKDQVPSPAQLIFHEGFSHHAMKNALGEIPGFNWLPRSVKERVLSVAGVAAGDLRRARITAKVLIQAHSLGEAVDVDIDTAEHQYQNCARLMNMQADHGLAPHKLEVAYPWIEANLSQCLDLEDAAECAANLAQLQCTPAPEALGETLHTMGAKYSRDGWDFPVQKPRWEDWRDLKRKRPSDLLTEQLHQLRRTNKDIGKQAHITHGNTTVEEHIKAFVAETTGHSCTQVWKFLVPKVEAYLNTCNLQEHDVLGWLRLMPEGDLRAGLLSLPVSDSESEPEGDATGQASANTEAEQASASADADQAQSNETKQASASVDADQASSNETEQASASAEANQASASNETEQPAAQSEGAQAGNKTRKRQTEGPVQPKRKARKAAAAKTEGDGCKISACKF